MYRSVPYRSQWRLTGRLAVSIPVVAAAAVLLLRITGNGKIKSDAAIAMISAGSLAIGIIVTLPDNGMTTDVSSYMFGSILAMSREDMYLSVVLSVIVLGMFVICYNKGLCSDVRRELRKGDRRARVGL